MTLLPAGVKVHLASRTALPWGLPRLSLTTMSPGFKLGTRTLST